MADKIIKINTKNFIGDVSTKVEKLDDLTHWKITLTGNGEGYFKDGLVGGYQEMSGDWVKEHPFSIDGNVATLIAVTNYWNTVEIYGEFVKGTKPPTPTNLLTYDTTGFTGDITITDKQGTDEHHFDVTVTGNGDGTFSNLKASYQNGDGDWESDVPFNVSGNVGTLTVYCYKGTKISITGKFGEVTPPTPPEPPTGNSLEYDRTKLIGDVTVPDKQGTDKEHFVITVTGNGKGHFLNLSASYQDGNVS